MDNILSIKYFLPEIALIVTSLLILPLSLIFKTNVRKITIPFLTFGFIISFTFLIMNWDLSGHGLFFNLVAYDRFSQLFKLCLLIFTFFLLLISLNSSELKNISSKEYHFFIFILLLGSFLLVSSNNLLMIYISIETLSIACLILVGYLKTNKSSNIAAVKNLFSSLLSSAILIYGLSLVYGLTGTLNLPEIGHFLSNSSINNFSITVIILIILFGFGYKLTIVPFHIWSPDVYKGATTPITAFLTTVPKVAGFAILIRVLATTFSNANFTLVKYFHLSEIIAVLAAATMTLGNLLAINQKNIKGILAYSSITHSGFILMGLAIFGQEGISASIFYLIMYSIAFIGVFTVVINSKTEFQLVNLKNHNSLNFQSSFSTIIISIFLISLTGLPPTAGFVGKFYLFAALIKGGTKFYWLVIIGIINCIIMFFYHARIIHSMLLYKNEKHIKYRYNKVLNVILILLVIPTILFGIYWTPLFDFIKQSLHFFMP